MGRRRAENPERQLPADARGGQLEISGFGRKSKKTFWRQQAYSLDEVAARRAVGSRNDSAFLESRACWSFSRVGDVSQIRKFPSFMDKEARQYQREIRLGARCWQDQISPKDPKETPLRNDLVLGCPSLDDVPKRPVVHQSPISHALSPVQRTVVILFAFRWKASVLASWLMARIWTVLGAPALRCALELLVDLADLGPRICSAWFVDLLELFTLFVLLSKGEDLGRLPLEVPYVCWTDRRSESGPTSPPKSALGEKLKAGQIRTRFRRHPSTHAYSTGIARHSLADMWTSGARFRSLSRWHR